ncbi:sugar transferase [Flavobacterium sp. NRK1]|uniref:sugar transferase n=1 Tax=Flavobacterium sp. NRK1 TaxID=2954929 RepID=UPI002092D5BA|nr:sugar transferase [Flavobacterium sp. NRK1]MCO6146880.1 sugar transferase [Flavobacterium sp. NRK1]
MYRTFFKRLIDITASLICIIIFAPLFFIVGLIIYLQDRGNPFFRQSRVGLYEKQFVLMKFRSMPVNTANVPSNEVAKIKITPFGKFIRRSNLDELPQLFNIFLGEMSIVGPRPALPSQTELVLMRREKNAYSCRPGLTGLAQVNSYDNMPETEKAKWDGIYAGNLTFLQDVKIVLRTFVYLTKKPPTY